VDYARDVATALTPRTSHTLFATRGTTFALRRKPRDTIELVVLEGSTEVRHREPSELNPARISEDTVAGAIGHRLLQATRVSTFELSAKVGWLDRRVALGPGTTLREAAQEFNRYNEVQLLVVGSMGEVQVRGDFDVDQPHTFADTIVRMTDAELHVSGKLITIREPEQPTRR
jgi:transmembrane sensor